MKYDYTLYNDDCILNTETNTIVYEDDSEWKEYLNWKKKNSIYDTDNKLKRENILLWNGGLPIIKNNEKFFYNIDGVLIKHEGDSFVNYYNNKFLYKRDTFDKDGNVYEERFTKNNILFKKIDFRNNITYNYNVDTGKFESFLKKKFENNDVVCEEYFSSQSVLIKKIDYTKNITYTYDDKNGKLLSVEKTRNNLKYIKIYHKEFLQETHLKNGDVTLQKRIYYPSSKKIRSVQKLQDNKFIYQEYFTSGKLRASGYLNNSKKPNGIWKYYHLSGMIESEHKFNNGYLIGYSKLYYENGNLIGKVFHD